MIKKFIVILGIMPFLVGCQNKSCDEIRELINPIKKDVVIKKRVKECDTNQLISEQEFRKSDSGSLIANGYYKEYFPSGQLKTLKFYKNDRIDSLFIDFYADGGMKCKGYYSNDHLSGPQFIYYHNGADSTIDYCRLDGTVWLHLQYDGNGKIVQVKGKLLNIIMDPRKPRYNALQKGDVLVLINEVPIISKIKTEMNIRLLQNNIVFYDTTVSNFRPLYNIHVFGYARKFSKPGSYNFIASVKLTDSVNGAVIAQDTTMLNISVK